MVRSESKAAYWSFTSASVLLSFIEKPKSKLLSHYEIVPVRADLRGRDVKSAYRAYKSGGRINLYPYERKQSMSLCDWKRAEGNECFYEYRYIYIYVYKKKNMAIYSFTYIEVAELYALSLPFDPIIFLRKRNTLLFDKIETNRSFNLE